MKRPAKILDGPAIEALITRDFTRFDADYAANKAAGIKRLAALEAQMIAAQEAGNALPASNQIFIEAKWLATYTADWKRLAARLGALEKSFSQTDQSDAERQSAADGAWGRYYDRWFLKFDASIDAINQLADRGQLPAYRLRFLERIDSIDKLTAYLDDLRISDIAATGVDNRDALGAVSAGLAQLCFKKDLRDYIRQKTDGFDLSDAYIEGYRRYLDAWQDPAGGFWGAWFQEGALLAGSNDLSLTFHIVSYRKGHVDHMPTLMTTLLDIKDGPYPYGWKHNGQFNNHNDYDVARLLRDGWGALDGDGRNRARAALNEALDWCLNCSMTADGGFIDDPTFYNSLGAAYYFGVAFLSEVGYFDPAKRFWTDQAFPDGPALCARIRDKLLALDLDDDYARSALEKLNDSCPGSDC